MLTEGKTGRAPSTYIVTWVDDTSDHKFTEVLTWNAQFAVDFARKYRLPEGAEIICVAKVVNNWT